MWRLAEIAEQYISLNVQLVVVNLVEFIKKQIGRGGDKRISRGEASYHACGETHEASVTDDFIQNCYYIPQSAYNWRRGWDTSKAIDVVVWRGPKGNNTHCTTNLDPKTWETAKS